MTTRRAFLEVLAAAGGFTFVLPLSACGSSSTTVASGETGRASGDETTGSGLPPVPRSRPEGWDPIAFNRERGNAGAIPASYRASINGPDGDLMHIGKHLPYVPRLTADVVPAGMLPLMWGDPALGRARHPNAPPSEQLPTGHWFDWVRVRKATDDEAVEVTSTFGGWPTVTATDNGRYAAAEGDDPTADQGKNTVYLVHLPPDVRSGDLVRVHGHCLTHGEYVDFVTVP